MSDLTDLVALTVRRERAGRRWSQDYMAEQLGWSRQVLTSLEGGFRQNLTLDEIEALCLVLEIPLAELLGRSERGLEAAQAFGLEKPAG